MAGRRLSSAVTVQDGDGALHDFRPGDDLPSWAVKVLDDAAKDAGLDRHPALVEAEPEKAPKKSTTRHKA